MPAAPSGLAPASLAVKRTALDKAKLTSRMIITLSCCSLALNDPAICVMETPRPKKNIYLECCLVAHAKHVVIIEINPIPNLPQNHTPLNAALL